MPFVFAFLLILTLPLGAQESTPTPEPEATASPAAEASPSPQTDATPAAEASPTPEASPVAESSPAPESTPEAEPTPGDAGVAAAEASPSPAAADDVIPLPDEPGNEAAPIVSETEVPTMDRPDEPVLDDAFTDPNAVIPDAAALPDMPAGPAGPSAAEEARRLRVRYQEVRTQVEKDPAVRSLWQQARAAKSFEAERAALREYYRLLFKKMRSVDKDLTARCDMMERAYLARLAQTRVEPTIPLEPPPTPAPLAE